MAISENVGDSETLLELRSDGTSRIKFSDYPDYILECNYDYNSLLGKIKFSNIDVQFLNDMEDFIKDKIREKARGDINLWVKEWSLDSIVTIDIGGKRIKMYRVESFDFSDAMTFTDFTVTVKYPDNSMNNKVVVTEVRFIENAVPPVLKVGKFEEDTLIHNFRVGDNFVIDASTKISIVSYIFDSDNNYNIDFGTYADRFAAMLVNSHYRESSYNPWQEEKTYKVVLGKYKTDNDNNFLVTFQKRLK